MNRLLWTKKLIHPLIAVLVGLITGAAAIAITGEPVFGTYAELWNGAFGNFYYFTSTLTRSVPILLVALGVAVAFKAGFFNLGAEGQMVMGGVAGALAALYIPGPPVIVLPLSILSGFFAGALLSLLATWINIQFKVDLLIVTLLLNYIAVLFAGYLVSGPFKDQTGSAAMAQTEMIESLVWLPKLFAGMSLHAGFIIALVLAVGLYFMMYATTFGYEMRMTGSNPRFAKYGGVHRTKILVTSMLLSGGLAGLAGTSEVLGMQYRFIDGALTTPGYAWTGLMAALLANSNPLGAIAASILLAGLQTGAAGVERNTEVPLEIASIIQAVLILMISSKFVYRVYKKKKGRDVNGTAI